MKYSEILDRADKAIANGEIAELLSLCENLIGCDDESVRPSGYLLKGMAYEIGGDGVEQDFEKAVSYYRQSAYLQPNAMAYVFMARAMMKKGQESYSSALRHLKEAEKMKYVPELDIAFGMCYEGSPEPNYPLAKKHYLRAAMRGRFHGFFGYSSVSRKMGQRARAYLVDFIRVLIGPFLFLIFGRSASSGI
jgi:TPR repeat protein